MSPLFDPAVVRAIEFAAALAPRWMRDDARQEALLACWLALPRYDPARASLQTFLGWRARGAVRTMMQRGDCASVHHRAAIRSGRAVEISTVSIEAAAEVVGVGRDPEEAAAAAELWRAVGAALGVETKARVVELLYREDLGAARAAVVLGLSVATVRCYRGLALVRLRERLHGYACAA